MDVSSVSGPEMAAIEAASRPKPTTQPAPQEKEAPKAEERKSPEPPPTTVGTQPTRGGTRLHVDEPTDRVVATIVDQSNNVIKQIPPEEQLDVLHRINAVQGMLFDEII